MSTSLATAARESTSVVLCYHGVGVRPRRDDTAALTLPPSHLRAQIELLLAADFQFVTATDLASRTIEDAPEPGLVAFTFDDGLEDNYSTLLPILVEYAIPATVYIATGSIGTANPYLPGSRMMTADELRSMASYGVELGAHTVSHPDLSRLDRATCLREMVDSREALELLTGSSVRTFAYPFCRDGGHAPEAARQAAFLAAMSCGRTRRWERFTMNRSVIKRGDSLVSFAAKLHPGYDRLHASGLGRLARASTRGARRTIDRSIVDAQRGTD